MFSNPASTPMHAGVGGCLPPETNLWGPRQQLILAHAAQAVCGWSLCATPSLSSPPSCRNLSRPTPLPNLYVPGLVVKEEHVLEGNPRGSLYSLEVCDLGPDIDLPD